MGVKGLWTLLEPCGRRIDVHALRGKKLAIDASVWIFRFLKAMRDERGDPLPNAHLIGFLRRICKLLYLNIWPVFVFDGSTPALKRKTVQERRKRREQQQARVKRTAEKLLLNRLKQYALTQVKDKGFLATSNETSHAADASKELPASRPEAGRSADADVGAVNADKDASSSENDANLLGFEVDIDSGVDPEVLSTLPPSMQLEIMLQVREKKMNAARGGFEVRNGKPEEFSQYQMQQYLKSTGLRRQLDAIRGVSRQETDVARRVAGEEETHYVLYREEAQAEQGERPTGNGSDAIASPLSNSAALTGKRALNITFDVEGPDGDQGGDDMEWEDVEEGEREAEVDEDRHRRSKYWSLSHGFQKGRSLGNWGSDDDMEEDGNRGTSNDGMAVADVAEQVEAITGNSLRHLIDDEQGMINEAIKRSLQDISAQEVAGVDLTTGDGDAVPGKRLNAEQLALDRSDSLGQQSQGGIKVSNVAPVGIPDKSDGIWLDEESKPHPVRAIDGMEAAFEDKPVGEVDQSPTLVPASMHPAAEQCVVTSNTDEGRVKHGEEITQGEIEKAKVIATEEPVKVPTKDLREAPGKVPGLSSVKSDDMSVLDLQAEADNDAQHISPGKPPVGTVKRSEATVHGNEAQTHMPHAAVPLPDLAELEKEESLLRADRRKASGQGDSPTDQMFTECQELLQLFGIPYIIAPTEAEAQCAWLDSNGLVDGVVTDDNDAFLFGGRRVYRHIFEESKYVEEYRTDDVERELGLSRESLICLALLLGSDYTPGISGVGIVNAVEIMSTFPGYKGLVEFEKWVNGIDEDIIAMVTEKQSSESSSNVQQIKEFKSKHKAARKSWVLPEDFPSKEVMDAYRSPGLDKSKEKFTFVSPDFQALSMYCMRKFGWEESQANDLLNPVEKALKVRDTQRTLDGFLFRERFAKVKSKRLAQAMETVKRNRSRRDSDGGDLESDCMEKVLPSPAVQEVGVAQRKKRVKKDPNAPKKASSAYIFFSNEKRAEVKKAHPELKSMGMMAKRLGEMWKALSESDRKPYQKMANDDKERYMEEMTAYRERLDASLLPGSTADTANDARHDQEAGPEHG